MSCNVLMKQLRDVSSTVLLDVERIHDDCDDGNTNECGELESGIQIIESELSEELDVESEGPEVPPFSPLSSPLESPGVEPAAEQDYSSHEVV